MNRRARHAGHDSQFEYLEQPPRLGRGGKHPEGLPSHAAAALNVDASATPNPILDGFAQPMARRPRLYRSNTRGGIKLPAYSIAAAIGIALAGCSGQKESRPGEAFIVGPVFAVDTPTLVHQFSVTNTTGRAVRILGETHSCSCTEVELARKLLRPGESTPLTMKVRVPEGHSQLNLSSIVTTDHPEFPEWQYHLKFESYPRASIAPDRIDLGTHQAGTGEITGEAWLQVFGRANNPLPTPGDISPPEGITVALDQHPSVELLSYGVQRASYRLKIGLDVNPSKLGYSSQSLAVRVGDGAAPTATVVWRKVGPVECAPTQVHFGVVGAGDLPKKGRVIVRSSDGRVFRLLSVDGGSARVRVEPVGGELLPSPAATSHVLALTLDNVGDDSTNVLSGVARIKTDLAVLPEISIPWSLFPRRTAEHSGRKEISKHVPERMPQ